MRILTTFPGKVGDIIWSLPTVRAISRFYSTPVEFACSREFGKNGLDTLLKAQNYIADMFEIPFPSWEASGACGDNYCILPEGKEYDKVIHLGYKRWPEKELAQEIYDNWIEEGKPEKLDMSPWIAEYCKQSKNQIFVGWSQEWIELKMGITTNLASASGVPGLHVSSMSGGRQSEWLTGLMYEIKEENLWEAALHMQDSRFYLGCLSSLWVLANALGKHCVVVEPAEARWNKIFWREDEKNVLVRGGDGKPTFDARHVKDAVRDMLRRVK